jgi:hypothetical protein
MPKNYRQNRNPHINMHVGKDVIIGENDKTKM